MALVRAGTLALCLSLAAMLAAPRPHVPAAVIIRVVDSASLSPLPNVEVYAAPSRRLTDTRGEARFIWPQAGSLTIRVRQLGYRYVTRTLRRGESLTAMEDTVVVPLSRAPFALPQVATQASSRCDVDDDRASAALSASAMEQLRFGAQQYATFSAAYPFALSLSRRTVWGARGSTHPGEQEHRQRALSSEWGDPYQPGQVLARAGVFNFQVSILFVSALADSSFWDRHCFVARGVETREGRRTIRLDFSTARDVKDVDWEGSAWLDSAAGVLSRVDFRLANLRAGDPVRRLEGYSIFAPLSPYIAMPESTVAWWWTRGDPGRAARSSDADVFQALKVLELAYLRAMPPPFSIAPDSAAPR